jgi:toxin YoeB
LIQSCLREPFDGIGKPAPLKESLSGFWSRRIDDASRLVYRIDGQDLILIACRYHYK